MARGSPSNMAVRTRREPPPGCLILYACRPASRALRVDSADGLRPPLTPGRQPQSWHRWGDGRNV
jgi:hypothetical protein